jgi:hypothetical protein
MAKGSKEMPSPDPPTTRSRLPHLPGAAGPAGIYQPLPELSMSVLQRPAGAPHQRLKDIHAPKLNHDRLRSAFNMVATDHNNVPMVMGIEGASFVLRAYGAGMLESEIESFVDEFGERLSYTDFVAVLSRAQDFYLTKAWSEMATMLEIDGLNPYDRFGQFVEAYDTLLDREGEDRININAMEAMLHHLGEGYKAGSPNAPPSLFDILNLIRDRRRVRAKPTVDFEPWNILSGLAKYYEVHGLDPPAPETYSQQAFEKKAAKRIAAAASVEGDEDEEEDKEEEVKVKKPEEKKKDRPKEKKDKDRDRERRDSKKRSTEKDEKKARRNSKEEKEAKEDQQKRNAEKDGKGEKKGTEETKPEAPSKPMPKEAQAPKAAPVQPTPKAQPQVEPAQPKAQPHAEPHAQPHAEPHAQPKAQPHAEPHAQPHAEPHAQPHAQPHAEPHAEAPAQPHAEPHAQHPHH